MDSPNSWATEKELPPDPFTFVGYEAFVDTYVGYSKFHIIICDENTEIPKRSIGNTFKVTLDFNPFETSNDNS